MNEKELKKLIERATRLKESNLRKVKKIEYLMDFGKISTLIKISEN